MKNNTKTDLVKNAKELGKLIGMFLVGWMGMWRKLLTVQRLLSIPAMMQLLYQSLLIDDFAVDYFEFEQNNIIALL